MKRIEASLALVCYNADKGLYAKAFDLEILLLFAGLEEGIGATSQDAKEGPLLDDRYK